MIGSEPASEQIQRFQDRLRVVSEAARTFSEATTDYKRLLNDVARSLSEVVKDACSVFLLSEDGATMTPAALHANDSAALEQIREMFLGAPLVLAEQPALRKILATGEAMLVPRVNPTGARSDTTAAQVEWQRKLGLHSFLVVALRAHGRSIGVVSLGRFRPEAPPFDEDDRDLAEHLAVHASLAIENAQLYASAQVARRSAEHAEEVIRRSEQTHRSLFEGSPIATFVFDVNTLRLLAANSAALKLYGYEKKEFLELSLRDLRLPEDQVQLADVMRDARGQEEMIGTARHRRKDGTIVHVDGRSHPTLFEDKPSRFVIVQDHTKRVRAEAALFESEGRLRRTLDNMMEGYTILGPDLRYLYVNAAGARQARLPKTELLGRTPMELYPDFESSGIHALLQRCLRENVPVHGEDELTHLDGTKAWFEVRIQPTPEGLVILSMDTTANRRAALARESLEEQLRQSQKMDAVGRLAGGVAHDFNNLLSVILGYGETILATLGSEDPLRADLEEINKAAERAAELTRQLLMFSRQQVLEAKILNLNDLLGDLEKMLRRVLGEQLELISVLEPGLGRVRADRGNIEQIVMNLVVNARDAMPAGGKLTIETANVVLDEAFARTHLGTAPGRYVLLAVTDTGMGMDKATRLRIFEPFFTTKTPGRGIGLGLSTVFGIVQQSGGGIWVYSEPGRGTTFKVYLPRVEGPIDDSIAAPVLGSLRGSETILLVEDEEAVRVVAQRILERYGYRIIAAQNATEAFLLCEAIAEPLRLLLTDVVMPLMSGSELSTRLRARWPELKVLYMSGYTDGSIVSHGALETGMAFLQKPFTAESLARKVRSVLDGNPL